MPLTAGFAMSVTNTLSDKTRFVFTITSVLALVMFTAGATAGYYNSRDQFLSVTRQERTQALADYPTRLEMERGRSADAQAVADRLLELRLAVERLRVSVEAMRRR